MSLLTSVTAVTSAPSFQSECGSEEDLIVQDHKPRQKVTEGQTSVVSLPVSVPRLGMTGQDYLQAVDSCPTLLSLPVSVP